MYKLKLDFELENNIVENNLNIAFSSFLKQSLEEYDNNLYEKMFVDKNKHIRKYCYCLKMKPIKRESGKTVLENNKFSVELTSLDFNELIVFYNTFLSKYKENKKFSLNQNAMKLTKVWLLPYKPNISDHIIIQMQSPLVVRNYTDNGQEYLSIEDDNFEEILNKTVNRFLNDISLKDEQVQIKAIKAKRTVMSLFRFKANATLGVFEIKGDLKAISALSLSGIGSYRGAGAGMFKIIG